MATDPIADPKNAHENTAPRIVVAPSYRDPDTGAVYVHKDLTMQVGPWDVEAHIGPPRAEESFGDVESWVAYVKRYGQPEAPPFLTWDSGGFDATLDYHGERGGGNRCQWTARCPFLKSPEWTAWMGIATGHGIPQRQAVEFLDDHSPDITDPDAATLMAIEAAAADEGEESA